MKQANAVSGRQLRSLVLLDWALVKEIPIPWNVRDLAPAWLAWSCQPSMSAAIRPAALDENLGTAPGISCKAAVSTAARASGNGCECDGIDADIQLMSRCWASDEPLLRDPGARRSIHSAQAFGPGRQELLVVAASADRQSSCYLFRLSNSKVRSTPWCRWNTHCLSTQ
jgi:hypothetical protein